MNSVAGKGCFTNGSKGSIILGALALFPFAYAGLFFSSFLFYKALIFHPIPPTYSDSRDKIIKVKTANGKSISAMYLKNPKSKYTILYSHGISGDLGEERPRIEALRLRGYSVFAYDYQGYGTSEGSPSEENATYDIEAAYEYLTEKLRIPPDRIIAYGFSLGGTPSVHIAATRITAGLVLENTFVSAYRAVTVIPVFPMDRFKNVDKLRRLTIPVLVIHGRKDKMVNFANGERLFEAAPEPKRHLWVDDAGHHDILEKADALYWDALKEFTQLVTNHNAGPESAIAQLTRGVPESINEETGSTAPSVSEDQMKGSGGQTD